MIADQPPIAMVRTAPTHGIGTAVIKQMYRGGHALPVLKQTGSFSPPIRVRVAGGSDSETTPPRAPKGCRVSYDTQPHGVQMVTWLCAESTRLGMYEVPVA